MTTLSPSYFILLSLKYLNFIHSVHKNSQKYSTTPLSQIKPQEKKNFIFILLLYLSGKLCKIHKINRNKLNYSSNLETKNTIKWSIPTTISRLSLQLLIQFKKHPNLSILLRERQDILLKDKVITKKHNKIFRKPNLYGMMPC